MMPCSQVATLRGVVIAGWEGDLRALERAWKSDDAALRAASLSGLLRCGTLDAVRVIDALGDSHPTVRRHAAECVARMAEPPPAVIDAVTKTTTDGDPEVVEAACFALGEVCGADRATDDVGSDAARAVERVAKDHADPLCREAAVAALGAIGHPQSLDVVLAACRDKATIRRRAVLALAAFEDRRVEDMLRELLDDRDWQVRQAAEDMTAPPA